MPKLPAGEVLAANLKALMELRGFSQLSLAKKSGVGQTTISLYLDPNRRAQGASGTPTSAKIGHIEMLADALEVEAWELLRPVESERLKRLLILEKTLDQLSAPAEPATEEPAAAPRQPRRPEPAFGNEPSREGVTLVPSGIKRESDTTKPQRGIQLDIGLVPVRLPKGVVRGGK